MKRTLFPGTGISPRSIILRKGAGITDQSGPFNSTVGNHSFQRRSVSQQECHLPRGLLQEAFCFLQGKAGRWRPHACPRQTLDEKVIPTHEAMPTPVPGTTSDGDQFRQRALAACQESASQPSPLSAEVREPPLPPRRKERRGMGGGERARF